MAESSVRPSRTSGVLAKLGLRASLFEAWAIPASIEVASSIKVFNGAVHHGFIALSSVFIALSPVEVIKDSLRSVQ